MEDISDIPIITMEDILFNRVPLVDVNILSPTTTVNGEQLPMMLTQIRVNVAGWYFALRNFALTVSFATLLYIGVRMAFDSSGEKKARYKQMLTHWLVGFALIFVLHYIISFVLHINTAIVSMFATAQSDMGNYSNFLLEKAFAINLVNSWGAAIMYSALLVITLIFLIIYIKRMLMTCFLVMVAPLITITYSIDKIGNNRSEILNQWFKEFCYNVLIQPFHCIVYIVFVGTAVEQLKVANGLNFGAAITAIVYLLLMFTGEKIIRNIFGFTKSKSVSSKLFSGMMITRAIDDYRKIQSARHAGDDEEETGEETVPPPIMPSGEKTSIAMAQINQNSTTSEGETENEQVAKNSETKRSTSKNNSSNADNISQSSNRRSKIGKALEKVQNRTPVIIQDAGKRYIKGVKKVTGINAIQDHVYRRQLKKQQIEARRQPMSKFREQFLVASDQYAKQKGLSKQQLGWEIEKLRKTSFDKLKDNTDVIYKMWIDKMDKDLLKNGSTERTPKGRQDTVQAMRDFMDNKYES